MFDDEFQVSNGNSNTEICYDVATTLPLELSFCTSSLKTHPQVVDFTYLLGGGVIRMWRNLPIAQWSLDDIFQEFSPILVRILELENNRWGSPLLAALDRPAESLVSTLDVLKAQFKQLECEVAQHSQKTDLQKWLKERAAQIKQWCDSSDPPTATNRTGGLLYYLQQNADYTLAQMQEKLVSTQNKQQEAYFLDLLTAGTAIAYEQLEIQKKSLEKLITDYESAQLDCLSDEVSAMYSFFDCCDLLSKRGLFARKDSSVLAKAVQGLRKVFFFSLSAKLYDIGRFLLKNISLSIEERLEETRQADETLYQMQRWFEPESTLTPAEACLQEDLLAQINPYDLRLQLEDKIEHDLYVWYKLKFDSTDLESDFPPLIDYLSEHLYELLNPICCCYYYKVQQAKDAQRRSPPKKRFKQVHKY